MAIVLPVTMSEMKDKADTFFIELYELNLRTGTFYIAACDEEIEYNGHKYIPVPFQRESVTRSMDNIVDSCNITLADCSYELLRFILDGFDFRGCTATVYRIQYPDSLEDNSIVEWVYAGFIDEPSFAEGTFSCKIQTRFPEINVPNRTYQLACNSEFGDEECAYEPAEDSVVIVSATGNRLTLNKSYENNYWASGVITIDGESRVIEDNDGSDMRLNVNFLQENIIGRTAELVQGCNKSHERCKYYNNTIHYGGFPAIPFESTYR